LNTAYESWDGDDASTPRWDAAASHTDPQHLATLANEHLPQMRAAMDGFESAAGEDPAFSATMREHYAPMYYDRHRMELAADPANTAHHLATQDLARKLAESQPYDLNAAQALCAGLGSPAVIAHEYLLYKHSLLQQHASQWPDGAGTDAAKLADLALRPHELRDVQSLDQTLNATFGRHTRSPQLARVGFVSASPNALLRGTTSTAGDMLLGKMPGNDEATYHNNAKTQVEEMAHSILRRHLKDGAAQYSHWMAQNPSTDPHASLSTHAHEMGIPESGDYTEELAHAMAHGVFAKPSMHPESPEAPADQSVSYAARLFRQTPVVHPIVYRGL
jgi:hypothetical protein